jgi:alpha-D-ribose 1-methylphosphonate 5-triphosphate diphosphatase
MSSFVLKNARIVTPQEIVEGSVEVRNGVIDCVEAGDCSLATAIDCEGDYVIPGMIDLHTDHLERMLRPRNSVSWPVLPALIAHDAQMVTAGITTILDSLCVGFQGHAQRSFEMLKCVIAELETGRQQGLLRGDHYLHLRCEISKEEMPGMLASIFPDPRVLLVSMMDHTPGQRQYRDMERYVAMEKRDFHLTEEQIDEFVTECRERHERLSRPNRARLLAMTEGHSVAIASHDDATVEHIEEARGEGVTISEFPTTQEAAEAARANGMKVVVGAPNLVLGRSHSGNVAAARLVENGLVDALASDYVPSSMLHGAFLLHEIVGLALTEAIAMVTQTPAQMTGLTDRGAIEIGKRADLVRVHARGGITTAMMVWREGQRVA